MPATKSYFAWILNAIYSLSVDCTWGNFKPSGNCTEPCGGGIQIFERSKTQIAQNGGKDCEGSVVKMEKCNENPCPGNEGFFIYPLVVLLPLRY